jgi:hypothetical protein
MNEVWEPWVFEEQKDEHYYCVGFEEKAGAGLTILLSTTGDDQKLSLTWDGVVKSYRNSDESVRCSLRLNQTVPTGTFFKVKNSAYFTLRKGQTPNMDERVHLTHFCIYSDEEVIDVVAESEPRIEVLTKGTIGFMSEKYLPIGSVVLLKEGKKRLMIYGRRQRDTATNKDFDYLGCLYPEGNVDKKFSFMFNHRDIAQIFHRGCDDAENMALTDRLLRK